MHRFLFFMLSCCVAFHAHAFQCYLTMVKDSCWTNYNVTVEMKNAKTGKTITSVVVPQGQSWTRQAFTCQPADILSFQATFNPAFWSSEEGNIYQGNHFWNLPKVIKPKEAAWNVTVCYPNSFLAVPMPPDAQGTCKCNTQAIPPMEPQ